MLRTPAELDEQTLASPEFFVNPYPYYQRLRERDPVHWSDHWNCWVLTRYADVQWTMRDLRFSNSMRIALYLDQLPEPVSQHLRPLRRHIAAWAGFQDPPNHTRFRTLLNAAFNRRLIDGLPPRVESIVGTLLRTFEDVGTMDVIRDFAYPLPAIVIASLLGVPPEDCNQFKRWSDDIVAFLGTGRAITEVAEQAHRSLLSLSDYFTDLIKFRRSHPTDDLLSFFIAASERDLTLTHEELIATCTSLLIAGHETTTNLIGNGVLALLQHPDQLRTLILKPSLVDTAVEEVLRYECPVQRNWRAATQDMEVGGKQIRRGQILMQMLGAANRDPEYFPNPDSFQIDRQPNHHLSFGHGIHFCVGAPLARMEARVAFKALLGVLPYMEPTTHRPEWCENMAFRGLKSLPVVARRPDAGKPR